MILQRLYYHLFNYLYFGTPDKDARFILMFPHMDLGNFGTPSEQFWRGPLDSYFQFHNLSLNPYKAFCQMAETKRRSIERVELASQHAVVAMHTPPRFTVKNKQG